MPRPEQARESTGPGSDLPQPGPAAASPKPKKIKKRQRKQDAAQAGSAAGPSTEAASRAAGPASHQAAQPAGPEQTAFGTYVPPTTRKRACKEADTVCHLPPPGSNPAAAPRSCGKQRERKAAASPAQAAEKPRSSGKAAEAQAAVSARMPYRLRRQQSCLALRPLSYDSAANNGLLLSAISI